MKQGGSNETSTKPLRIALDSDECLILLRQALQVAEQNRDREGKEGLQQGQRVNRTNVSRFAVVSSEEEEDDDNKEESSSTEDEEEEEEEDEDPKRDKERNDHGAITKIDSHTSSNCETSSATPRQQQQPQPKSTPSGRRRTPPPSSRRKKKSSMTGIERENFIRSHAETLICSSFPLERDSPSMVLELPLSLLSKEERRLDQVEQCAAYIKTATELNKQEKPIVVFFLRSGRFAGAVFGRKGGKATSCLAHKTSQRYTIRRGQGKSQSAQDNQNGKAQSMGAQLRRAGEIQLQQDVAECVVEWRDYIRAASLVLISCPKTMQKAIFVEGNEDSPLKKDDPRIRRIPLDMGRPTFENVSLIHDILMCATKRENVPPVEQQNSRLVPETNNSGKNEVSKPCTKQETVSVKKDRPAEPSYIPLSALHVAAKNGDLDVIQELLETLQPADVNLCAGEDFMTPLHYAAQSTQGRDATSALADATEATGVDPSVAADCVLALLIQGGADPCLMDARSRPPYFLAHHEKVREAFRLARGELGEDYYEWDDKAKVGPALTNDDLQQRKESQAEKKKKKRARQKEKKARERAHAEEMEARRVEEERREQEAAEAKRIRDGLQPKPQAAAIGGSVCDFCQSVCKGRRRNQMFHRLDYIYCSSDCVQKHKRELMAAAAMARLGGN